MDPVQIPPRNDINENANLLLGTSPDDRVVENHQHEVHDLIPHDKGKGKEEEEEKKRKFHKDKGKGKAQDEFDRDCTQGDVMKLFEGSGDSWIDAELPQQSFAQAIARLAIAKSLLLAASGILSKPVRDRIVRFTDDHNSIVDLMGILNDIKSESPMGVLDDVHIEGRSDTTTIAKSSVAPEESILRFNETGSQAVPNPVTEIDLSSLTTNEIEQQTKRLGEYRRLMTLVGEYAIAKGDYFAAYYEFLQESMISRYPHSIGLGAEIPGDSGAGPSRMSIVDELDDFGFELDEDEID